MPSQANDRPRSTDYVNSIQVLEEVVDRVFRKYHLTPQKRLYTLTPAAPPTLRLVMEEFPELQEIIKAVA